MREGENMITSTENTACVHPTSSLYINTFSVCVCEGNESGVFGVGTRLYTSVVLYL